MFRSIAGAALALLCSFSLQAGDLDEILALNFEAEGGERLGEVHNVRIRLSIAEPGFEVSGIYVASRSGEMRIDVEADGQRVFSEGLLDGAAWQWTPGEGVSAQGEAEAAALRHGIEMPGRFYTLQDVRERGASLTLVGEVVDGDRSEWQVRVVLVDGLSRDYFIDQATHRMTRQRDRRAFHPGIDPTPVAIETRFEDYEWVVGILTSMRQEQTNLDTGDWLGTTRVLAVERDVAEIETLLQQP